MWETTSSCFTTCTSRVPPILAMKLSEGFEQYRPFFVERLRSLRRTSAILRISGNSANTPMAMGELFNNTNEWWLGLVTGRLIDFIPLPPLAGRRSDDGREDRGVVRILLRPFGVAMAPAMFRRLAMRRTFISISPFRTSASEEARRFVATEKDVFPGCPELKNGSCYANVDPAGAELEREGSGEVSRIADDPRFDMQWGSAAGMGQL